MNNTLKDFSVKTGVPNQSWTSIYMTLKGESAQDIKDRLTYRFDLTPEHTFDIQETKVYPSTERIVVDSYPYGRKRTTAYFSLEFNAKNGFRTVFQTVNPATGLLNKEKKSTYHPVILPTYYNGFADYAYGSDFNGKQAIDRGVMFMQSYFDMFTPEQNEYIYGQALVMLLVDMKASIVYKGAKKEDIEKYYTESIEAAKYGVSRKGADNVWDKIGIDEKAISAHYPENFQAFKMTSYGV